MAVTKRDIVLKVTEYTGLTQVQVTKIVQMLLDSLADELAVGRTIELRNFGVFEVKVAKERTGRNPKKPENEIKIPEHCVAKFRAGKELKHRIEKLNPDNV
jgi:nucleoid DNA-binding protein